MPLIYYLYFTSVQTTGWSSAPDEKATKYRLTIKDIQQQESGTYTCTSPRGLTNSIVIIVASNLYVQILFFSFFESFNVDQSKYICVAMQFQFFFYVRLFIYSQYDFFRALGSSNFFFFRFLQSEMSERTFQQILFFTLNAQTI